MYTYPLPVIYRGNVQFKTEHRTFNLYDNNEILKLKQSDQLADLMRFALVHTISLRLDRRARALAFVCVCVRANANFEATFQILRGNPIGPN